MWRVIGARSPSVTRAGADTIVIRGHDDLRRILRERVAAARPRRVAADAMTELAPWVCATG